MRVRLFLILASLASLFIASVPIEAQTTGGTISGVTKDETGAMLPGATVVITNTETGRERTLVTDPNGRYTAPDLAPGPYEIKATLVGFQTVTRSGIRLTVGRDAIVELTMKLGNIEDAITVVGESPTVDTKSASTGGLIATEQIEGLPLNGRSYVELASLTPGVQLTQTGGQGTSTGFGAKLSVNGSRYTANLFTLDGTNLNDQFSQAGSASGNVLGVEAVREFQVLTNSFSAEYGHHTGGVINAATKSGTNVVHGSGFEFHRNDALDAKNFFDDEKPPFTRNQFGFSLGGPIVHNKTFFFTTYEGLHERLGQTYLFTVPSASVRAGADPRIAPFLNSYPMPNGAAFGTTRGEFGRVDQRKTDEHYVMGRVDHQLTQGQQLFVRYTMDDGQVDDPSRLNTGALTKTRVQFVTAEHTWVRGSALLHRVQFGFTRSRLDGVDYVLPGETLPRTTFTDIDRGILVLSVTGLSPYGGESTNPKFHRFNNFQIRDSVTYTRGAHNIKFGGDIQILQYNLTSDFTSMGQFTFNSLDDFLAVRPNTFDAVMPGSDATRNLRQKAFGLYVQDDIQVTRNLTLNLGVRYDPTTSITDKRGLLAQLIDFASPTATLNDTTVLDAIIRNPSKKTVAPRAGFAWNVGGTGKMAIRGGYGIFYDSILVSTPYIQNTAVRVPPFFNRGGLVRSSTFAIDFPEAYTTQRARLAGQAQLEGIQYDLDQPYMTKWNLNVQRELPGKITTEIGYSGSHGEHLVRQIFTNGRVAQETADGRLFVPPGTPLRQPNFARNRYRVSDATSDYHGLTVGANRRFSAGLQTQVSYTYSKSIDEGASALGGNDFTSEGGGSRYLFLKDRGLSPFDLRHSFVANVNYTLPFGSAASGAKAALTKDWSIGGLVRMRTGYPFSALSGVDTGQQVNAPRYPDLKGGASNNPVLGQVDRWFDPNAFALPPAGYIGNLGRNTITGPDSKTVDLIVGKGVTLGGNRELQFRLECFNLLNRANFGLPQQAVFNTNGTIREDAGRITTTSTSARQIQIGVKAVW
jgi:carboxypeptidase family protein/TonB-dependent receptor-like protein